MKVPLDIFVFVAFTAIVAGVFFICWKLWGGSGGNGGTPVAFPSTRNPGGGWNPGGVSTQVRNGGLGGVTPNVSWN